MRHTSTLNLLDEILKWANKKSDLFGAACLNRFIEKFSSHEITEDHLPLHRIFQSLESYSKNEESSKGLMILFLTSVENYETQKIREKLHFEVTRRSELFSRLNNEKHELARKNDAIRFLQVNRDIELLKQEPFKTRQIDPETVELALKAIALKEKHPRWTYAKISTELFGDPSEGERIKKAVARARKSIKGNN